MEYSLQQLHGIEIPNNFLFWWLKHMGYSLQQLQSIEILNNFLFWWSKDEDIGLLTHQPPGNLLSIFFTKF
jgi:hypothetical protein